MIFIGRENGYRSVASGIIPFILARYRATCVGIFLFLSFFVLCLMRLSSTLSHARLIVKDKDRDGSTDGGASNLDNERLPPLHPLSHVSSQRDLFKYSFLFFSLLLSLLSLAYRSS